MPITSSKLLQSSNVEDVVDYFIKAAKLSIQNEEFDWAKASLMSASALQPDNYLIRYESLEMCKMIGNVKDAARKFVDLFSPTSLQPIPQTQTRSKKVVDTEKKQKQFKILKDLFVKEMKNVLMAIHEEWSEFSKNNLSQYLHFDADLSAESMAFYKNMFFYLSKDDQIHVLTKFSTFFADNHIVTVDLLLYIIEKYPKENAEMLSECACRLIEVKQELEAKADPQNSELITYLRKKYVFLILPVLFSPTSINRDESQMKQYFYDVIKYFFEDFVITPDSPADVAAAKSEYESKLIEITHALSRQMWNKQVTKTFEQLNLSNTEQSVNTIANFVETMDLSSAKRSSEEVVDSSSSEQEQILFYSLTLFAFSFSAYSSSLRDTVLVERLHTGFDQKKAFLPSKKRKLMQQYQPQPKLLSSDKKLSDNFNALVKLNKLFHSVKVLETNFNNFIKHVGLLTDVHFGQLQADTLLFSGAYSETLKLLESVDRSAELKCADPLHQLKRCMQRVSCHVRQNEMHKVARQLIKLLDLVNLDQTVLAHLAKTTAAAAASSSTTRQCLLLPLTLRNVFGFLVDCVVCLLKEILALNPLEQDLLIGHLVVLSQYKWPYYYETFSCMMEKLAARSAQSAAGNSSVNSGKFAYPFFTNYVFNGDVIEAMMAQVELPGFTLELAPPAPVDPNQPLNLHSTRGASRTYREDITALIHRQMERAVEGGKHAGGVLSGLSALSNKALPGGGVQVEPEQVSIP
ncbi:Integrator complex subunit 10 [Tyrophagus putrescentiae]|nr:Integrator complex subunit 10 [Tyrophagus putrescentiae]